MGQNIRFDQTMNDPTVVGVVPKTEEPLVLGADEAFVDALEEGQDQVQEYFQSIFRSRAETQLAALER